MSKSLNGLRVAILATDGVEEVELTKPRDALKAAQAEFKIVSLKSGEIQAMEKDVHPSNKIAVDADVSTDPNGFDALVLPGGTTNPDKLRQDPKAVAFVKHFVDNKKPIASICHGPWMLIEAGAVRGKNVTSWPSLKTDLRNAGANWVDEVCVRDDMLVTSRKPDDLPVFCETMVDTFAVARS
jgi:protease I